MSENLETREAIFYLLQHTGELLDRQLDQSLQEQFGLGMSQYKILALLDDGNSQGQRVLADKLGQTEAAVSRQISILGKKGFIQGRINEKNRRQHLVTITPKGAKILVAARLVIERYLTPFYEAVPEKQQKQLLAQLQSMHTWVYSKSRPGSAA